MKILGMIYEVKTGDIKEDVNNNDTKIYKVTDIDFCDMTIEASETDLSIADVPEDEVFLIEELLVGYRITLINSNGSGM